jgi:hypothetical protein
MTRTGPRSRTTNRTGTRASAECRQGRYRHLGVPVPVPPRLLPGSPGSEALVWVVSGLYAFRHRCFGVGYGQHALLEGVLCASLSAPPVDQGSSDASAALRSLCRTLVYGVLSV